MGNKGLYIPSEILTDGQLGAPQKLVFAVMLEAEKDGFVRLSARGISERLGMTREAAAANRLILRKLGYVERFGRTHQGYRIVKRSEGDRNG